MNKEAKSVGLLAVLSFIFAAIMYFLDLKFEQSADVSGVWLIFWLCFILSFVIGLVCSIGFIYIVIKNNLIIK